MNKNKVIEEFENRIKRKGKEKEFVKYREIFETVASLIDSYNWFIKPKGEIIIITYFLNSITCEAKIVKNPDTGEYIISGRQGEQILDKPFEIWKGYSRADNFLVGVSIYESDYAENDALIALIEGILNIEINGNYPSNDESGETLLQVEQIFESKLNEWMSDLGVSDSFIDKKLQPVEKFRIYFHWGDFNQDIVNLQARARTLDSAKVVIEGFGYNDFYRAYRKASDGSKYSPDLYHDEVNDVYYPEEFDAATGQYKTGVTAVPESDLLKGSISGATPIFCGGHYNWYNFQLKEVIISNLPESWITKWEHSLGDLIRIR
ncbi:MAG: hypothetical protein ACFE96_09970 [Candidatus Hermodarchaeota archaeon]